MKVQCEINDIPCFLTQEDIDNHRDDIIRINDKIMEGLKGTNIKSIDFCDASCGYIPVRLFHKDVGGFAFTSVKLNSDWSNIEEVIQDAIDSFKRLDKPEHIKSYKSFLEDGQRYGWD